jgi:4-amino-4-deoxy-L-arabinose transferase-like glycosyltransferase
MRTAEDAPSADGERRWVWAGLLAVLAGGLLLRLWGVRQGLPYVYNVDEATHFVTHAVQMFGGGLNPHYFANPPGFTYLLHGLFGLWYGGGSAAQRALEGDPTGVFTLARAASAVLGTIALWLLYLTGARLFSRPAGLLASAILAVAFLPVFYAHLAVNDVPTLAPLTLSLLGSAGVLRRGRRRDYVIAGVGLGLACASKYTAGIVILPLIAAVLARRRSHPREGSAVLAGVAIAAACALAAFLVANPYSLLDYSAFHSELVHQSTLSAEAQGKLGAPRVGGFAYYLWTLTWGLGWVPALAAVAGAVLIWRRDSAVGWMLVPAPILFLLFMGLQGRYFGRWLMPIFPVLALLAAFAALALARAGGRRLQGSPRWVRGAAAGLLVAVILAQGLIYSVHSGIVLSRADTRTLTRAWMIAHVPVGSHIVAEPVSPDPWARQGPGSAVCPHYLWCKYPSFTSRITPSGALAARTEQVGVEDYERTLSPALLGYYTSHGYCWVLTGSTESGRASADPAAVPNALAYYRALAQQGERVFTASPYSAGKGPVPFGFDWSFDYYPLAYARPGPEVAVYRLHGGRCGA